MKTMGKKSLLFLFLSFLVVVLLVEKRAWKKVPLTKMVTTNIVTETEDPYFYGPYFGELAQKYFRGTCELPPKKPVEFGWNAYLFLTANVSLVILMIFQIFKAPEFLFLVDLVLNMVIWSLVILTCVLERIREIVKKRLH